MSIIPDSSEVFVLQNFDFVVLSALLAKGVALQAGRVGQTVRVQNIDSRRVLAARVRADGTVVPLLEENE